MGHRRVLWAVASVSLAALGAADVHHVGAAPTADTVFTIAHVPDTQNEVIPDNPLMPERFRWLADQARALDLRFVVHSGDVVNWGVVEPAQFELASDATEILDELGVPYAYAIGNHDTAAVKVGGSAAPGDVHANLRNTTAFNEAFPLERFANVRAVFEPNKVDNIVQSFSAGGVDWLVITHEMWPRQGVVDWMRRVAETHPRHNIIVNTHVYTDQMGRFQTTGIYGDLTAQAVWDQFVSQYANIKIVFSAHYGSNAEHVGANYSERIGAHGNKVAQIMTAYHSPHQNHVRLLTIDTADDSISSSVFVSESTSAEHPEGTIVDAHSNFVARGMNWVERRQASTSTTLHRTGRW